MTFSTIRMLNILFNREQVLKGLQRSMRETIQKNLSSGCTGGVIHRQLATEITKFTCTPYKVRRLSVAETLAIQSMPKGFVLPEKMTLSNMFKTVGNGVPYLASKGIAQTIINFLKTTEWHYDLPLPINKQLELPLKFH
jgi:site-specific DNA-cytosine methylase